MKSTIDFFRRSRVSSAGWLAIGDVESVVKPVADVVDI